MNSENPYESPKVDVTDPEVREERRDGIRDRVQLIGTAAAFFLVMTCGGVAVSTWGIRPGFVALFLYGAGGVLVLNRLIKRYRETRGR